MSVYQYAPIRRTRLLGGGVVVVDENTNHRGFFRVRRYDAIGRKLSDEFTADPAVLIDRTALDHA